MKDKILAELSPKRNLNECNAAGRISFSLSLVVCFTLIINSYYLCQSSLEWTKVGNECTESKFGFGKVRLNDDDSLQNNPNFV